jgi:hypothetical protein
MSEKQENSVIHTGKSNESDLLTSHDGARQAILTDVSEHNLPGGRKLSVITYPTGEKEEPVWLSFNEEDLNF